MFQRITRFVAAPLALLLGSIIAPSVRADLIRVQMMPNSTWVFAPIDYNGVEPHAAADSIFDSDGSNIWNHFAIKNSGTVNPSLSNLIDSAGDATSVGISFTGTIGAYNDGSNPTSGSNALENEYFSIFRSTTVNYTISGLPANTPVTLYLYSPNFTLNDNGTGTTNRGYTLTANGNTINVPSGTGTGNNKLATVTTNASGNISGTWKTATGNNEGDWSGFQIAYPSLAVPEPSSLTLLGLGLASLAAYRWRRRCIG